MQRKRLIGSRASIKVARSISPVLIQSQWNIPLVLDGVKKMPNLIDLKHIKKLEGLHSSVQIAKNRKRKHLTIHADELPALEEAIKAALDVVCPFG
jgi:hypothetical protein